MLDVVVNAHSQGTVASYDVLQQSPLPVTSRVNALVTAGSPLRKYADLFSWGSDVGATASVGKWLNFWDAKDPVADPLDQPAGWHFGNEVVPRAIRDLGLFWALGDEGSQQPNPIADFQVDNLVEQLGRRAAGPQLLGQHHPVHPGTRGNARAGTMTDRQPPAADPG